MKQKDFIFNIFFIVFLNLLIKPFWLLGIERGVLNAVGAESFGIYFAVFSFTYAFNMLLDFGLTNFNNRNIAQNTQLLSKHISGILSLRILLAIVYLIIVLVVGVAIGYNSYQIKILLWMALNQFLTTLILYLRSNISALLMFKTDSFLSVVDKLLGVIICSVLIWGNVTDKPFDIMWFVYAQTASHLFAVAIALVIVMYKAKVIRLTWNFTFYIAILKKSFPFALLTMLMTIYGKVDSVMLERILPSSIAGYQTGIFASAFRLLESLVNIAFLFSVILLPLFAKMLKNKENLVPIIKSAFTILFFFSITSTVLLVAYRMPIMAFLYPEIAVESASVFLILMPCLIPFSMTYIFGTLLTANGNLRVLNITSAIAIVVNVLINFTLIPLLEARGAAIAALAAQTSIMIMQFILALKLLKIPYSAIPFLRCGLFTCLLVIATYIATLYLPFGLIENLTLCGIAALGLAFATRLIDVRFLGKFLQKGGAEGAE